MTKRKRLVDVELLRQFCQALGPAEEAATAAVLTLLSNPDITPDDLRATEENLQQWLDREDCVLLKINITKSDELVVGSLLDAIDSYARDIGFVAVRIAADLAQQGYNRWLHHSFVLVSGCDASEDSVIDACPLVSTSARVRQFADWRKELRELLLAVAPGREREKLWNSFIGIAPDKLGLEDGSVVPGLEVCIYV